MITKNYLTGKNRLNSLIVIMLLFTISSTSWAQSVPDNTVEVFDDENATDALTLQTDFDEIDDMKLTIRWAYDGDDVSAWHVYVKKNDGGFFFLNASTNPDARSFTWNNPDINTQFEFRVWGIKFDDTRIVLSQPGPMGYNLAGGEVIKLKKFANPDDLPAQSAVVVDDLFHSTDLSEGKDVDSELEAAIGLKFNPGEGEFFDSHILASTDGETFTFIGQTGAADLFFYRFDDDKTFVTHKNFTDGPQHQTTYWFMIVAWKTDGTRVTMRTGPVDYEIDQSTLIPTFTPTPTVTPTFTSTPTPSPTPTRTFTPTPTFTPTATNTPTPQPEITLTGKVTYLIDGDNATEGGPVAGSEVAVIPALYKVSQVTSEPDLGHGTTNSDGTFSLIMSATSDNVRLRVEGDNHHLHVSSVFSGAESTSMDTTVIPSSFNMDAYDVIFREASEIAVDFHGENVHIQANLSNQVPWLLLDSKAAESDNIPTQQEINIVRDIISNQLPIATRNLLSGMSIQSFDAPEFPPNYNQMGLPESYILGWWWDNPQSSILGTANFPEMDPQNPQMILNNDFSLNTLQKIREKFPHLDENSVINEFTSITLQMVGVMAGAIEPYQEGNDPGGLTASDSVFVEGTTARSYTQFDQDALYITYKREMFTSPDLNVALE